uniref:Cornichon family AMPA receptor auxiliary protein 3 n=1 Tax=Eptatretus burgeri TaxID=7764 RepID=A0A8C4NBF3_EPTBU
MAFSFAAFCFMLALVLTLALIFFAVWRIVAFDEIRRESNNPSDSPETGKQQQIHKIEKLCRMLKKLIVPEHFIHCLFCLMFLCSHQWLALLANIPLLLFNLWRFLRSPTKGPRGRFDPSCVVRPHVLAVCSREAWCKLGFYLLSLFYYLYSMVYNLMSPI